MTDNRLPRTAAQLADDVRDYVETKLGVRPARFLEERKNDIGETVAKLIDLRIDSGMRQPEWEDEEWSAMREHAESTFKFNYSLIQLIDSYIAALQKAPTA